MLVVPFGSHETISLVRDFGEEIRPDTIIIIMS